MLTIEFYKNEKGEMPVKAYIDSLDVKRRAKVLRTIGLLKKNGKFLKEPESKYLEDGILELRSKVGNDLSRILFFYCEGNKAVLTNGFTKKQQKTPRTQIEKAKRYRADYLSREVKSNG